MVTIGYAGYGLVDPDQGCFIFGMVSAFAARSVSVKGKYCLSPGL
jgi:hypothetical protein